MSSAAVLARLFYLQVETKAPLPNKQLMGLMGKTWAKALTTANESGIASGAANYEQLVAFYSQGAESGIAPTEQEFRALLTDYLLEQLGDKEETLTTKERAVLYGAIARYYEGKQGIIANERVSFATEAPPQSRFLSGFPALDYVAGNGLCTGVVTILAKTGNGKSSLSFAIAKSWAKEQGSSVWVFDPEMGKGMALTRINGMGVDWGAYASVPELFLGYYCIEDVLKQVEEEPDPDRLIIFDSLDAVCGNGMTPESQQLFIRNYESAIKLLDHCKLVIITTQIKRGSDYTDVEGASGSSIIEKRSSLLIGTQKGMLLPNGGNEVTFKGLKNRMGPGGLKQCFAFDYATCSYCYDLDKLDEQIDHLLEREVAE